MMKLGDECMNELTNRHLLIVGQTGSGKTTSTLTLLDQLQNSGQANIVLDPTGEYAQLPNAIVYRLGENAYLEPGEFSNNPIAIKPLSCPCGKPALLR